MSKASRTDRTSRFVTIGTISKTRGTGGAVIVAHPKTVSPDSLVGETVFLVPPSVDVHARTVVAAARNDADGTLVIELQGVDSRARALDIVGRSVVVSAAHVQVERAGEFGAHFGALSADDLVGWTALRESGEVLGRIGSVLETPAHHVIEVEVSNGEPVLIPVVDEFILGVDQASASVVVRLIAGMEG